MKKLTPGEMLSLRELIQMECNGLAASKASTTLITDPELKSIAEAGILSAEMKIKGLQKFIQENDVFCMQEVQ